MSSARELALPDNFHLDIYTNQILEIKGNWQIAFNIDKSAVQIDTLDVTSGIIASATSGWDQPYNHNITVDT